MLDLKSNFKIGQNDLNCRRCDKQEESQRHILNCDAIKENCIISNSDIPVYEDLFSTDLIKITNIGRIMINNFKIFTNVPTIVHGPTPSATTSVVMD